MPLSCCSADHQLGVWNHRAATREKALGGMVELLQNYSTSCLEVEERQETVSTLLANCIRRGGATEQERAAYSLGRTPKEQFQYLHHSGCISPTTGAVAVCRGVHARTASHCLPPLLFPHLEYFLPSSRPNHTAVRRIRESMCLVHSIECESGHVQASFTLSSAAAMIPIGTRP